MQASTDVPVQLVLAGGRRQLEILQDFGLGHSTLERWLSAARERSVAAVGGETPDRELKRPQRENTALR